MPIVDSINVDGYWLLQLEDSTSIVLDYGGLADGLVAQQHHLELGGLDGRGLEAAGRGFTHCAIIFH